MSAAGRLLTVGGRFGDCEVVRLLGKGGMGEVYLVRAADGRAMAAKVMSAAADEDSRRRFAREAAAAMEIRHPNLVQVYDVGEDPETHLCYILMEYVPGGSVAERLAKRGRFTVREAVSVVVHVAGALEAAHRKGLVHRDIKPANILFDAKGVPRLADLGIAKVSGGETTTITSTGMVMGTPAYMSPEQMIDSSTVDARSDIYSLGLVLYEMLAGARPCAELTEIELLAHAIKGEALPDVRTVAGDVPAALAQVVAQMCAPDRNERPASGAEVVALLRQSRTGGRVHVRRSSARLRRVFAWLGAPVCRWLAAVAAALALIAASFVAGGRVAASVLRRAPEPQGEVIEQARVIERAVAVTNEVSRTVDMSNVVWVRSAIDLTNVVTVTRVVTNVVDVVGTPSDR